MADNLMDMSKKIVETRQRIEELKRSLEETGKLEKDIISTQNNIATLEYMLRSYEGMLRSTFAKKSSEYTSLMGELRQVSVDQAAYSIAKDNSLKGFTNSNDIKEVSGIYDKIIDELENKTSELYSKMKPIIDEFNDIGIDLPEVSGEVKPRISGVFKRDLYDNKLDTKRDLMGEIGDGSNEVSKLNGEAIKLGANVDKINSRIRSIGDTIEWAINNGNIDKARSLVTVYWGEIDKLKDKVNGQSRAHEISIETQKKNIASLLNETKNYVSLQETLNNESMPFDTQAEYYTKQLTKFKSGTDEYLQVLKLKNTAERKSADEAMRAQEEEAKAKQNAIDLAKQRVQGILSAIGSVANGINGAVNKIINILRTGINIVSKIVSGFGKTISFIVTGTRNLIQLFGNLGNRIRQAFTGQDRTVGKLNSSMNILKGTATELRSKILLINGAFNGLFNNQMINKANELMSSIYSLRNIAGKQVTEGVIEWAKTLERAFGISAKDLIADINELTGVLYGLGMTAEDTAVGSQNILMISRYLAFMGAAGGDTSKVTDKLVSGMKGMTQAVDDLGLSVREAEMNNFLKSLKAQGGDFANISTEFSSLNEEARVYIRYASLIDQFTKNYNISNFANALTTVTGRMNILKQTISSLQHVIGTGLLKVLANISIYIIPVIKYIEQMITKLFTLMGIDVSVNVDMNEGVNPVEDLNSGLSDTGDKLDDIDKKAKKAKAGLQGFDRINNVTSNTGNEDSGGQFDYSKLMTTALADFNKTAAEMQLSFNDKIREELKNRIEQYKKDFNEYAKGLTGRVDFDLGFNWGKIQANLKEMLVGIGDLIKKWGTFVIEIGLKIADDINLGVLIGKLTELGLKIVEVANRISDVLIPILRDLYDNSIGPIVKDIGSLIGVGIDIIMEQLDRLAAWFEDNRDIISEFFNDLGVSIVEVYTVIKESVAKMWDSLTGDNEGKFIGDIKSMLGSLKEIVVALIPVVMQLVGAFMEFAKDTIIPWLVEKLQELSNWVTGNSQAIVDFFKYIGSMSWDVFTVLVDAIGKLIDYVVRHPEAVANFFKSILALKVVTWISSVVVGIGSLVGSIGKITELFGAGGGGLGIAEKLGSAGTAIMGVIGKIGAFIGPVIQSIVGVIKGIAVAMTSTTGIVVLAVVAIIAIFVTLWNKSEAFRDFFINLGESIVGVWNKVKDGVGEALSNIVTGVRERFDEAKTWAKDAWSDAGNWFNGISDKIASSFNGLKDKVGNIFKDVKESIVGVFDDIKDTANRTWDKIKNKSSNVYNGTVEFITGKTKATTARRVTTHAGGGSIAGGQLFIANEGGNAELIGQIDGSRKTNVANNEMITRAIFEAVYNAIAEAQGQTSNNGGNGNNGPATINIDGFGLIDSSTLMKLASLLAPYMSATNKNIANTNFSI